MTEFFKVSSLAGNMLINFVQTHDCVHVLKEQFLLNSQSMMFTDGDKTCDGMQMQ